MTRTSSSLWSFCCCFSLCLCFCCCCCCCCNELCCLGLDGTDMSQGKMAVSPLWYWTLPVTIDESGKKGSKILSFLCWFRFHSITCHVDMMTLQQKRVLQCDIEVALGGHTAEAKLIVNLPKPEIHLSSQIPLNICTAARSTGIY